MVLVIALESQEEIKYIANIILFSGISDFGLCIGNRRTHKKDMVTNYI